MIVNDKKRLELIEELLTYARPLQAIATELAEYEWDFDGCGVELRAAHLQDILKHYRAGIITAVDVEKWANLVESREDIFIGESSSHRIEDVLYELANPVLTQRLDLQRAADLHSLLLGKPRRVEEAE